MSTLSLPSHMEWELRGIIPTSKQNKKHVLSEIVMKLVKQNRIKKNQYRKENLNQEKTIKQNNKHLRQNPKTVVTNVEIKVYPSNCIGD